MVDIAIATGLITVFIGLGLAFLGRKVVKILIFLGAGLAGANIALHFLQPRFDQPIPLIGAFVGFLVLGFLSLMILKFMFGLMLGIAGFMIAAMITGNQILAILVGIIVFVIGLFLFKYYLSLATAFAGGVLVLMGLERIGLARPISLLIALVIGLLGAYVQFKQLH